MPFSILQHRRGTTQEWQELDLIPKDGELVIEECLDGTRKCKIGNGKTRFSKLPYIADYAKNELLLEINKLENLITETQQDTLNKAQVEIDKLDEAFGKRLSSNMKAILDKVIDFNENTSELILEHLDGTYTSVSIESLIANAELSSNKVTTLSSSSTDTQYPSAKCVYDIVGDISSALDSINGEVI
jgi:hypothetical protein